MQGSMGLQKSKFFRSLVKDASWFSSGVSSSKASEKDQKITLHSGWLHDLGEVGSIYRKKEIQELRQFITSTHDEFRPPYARESEVFARRFVFCGTANENDFMADSYGSRRWWIVPVSKKIAIPSSSEVDAIWKSALSAYNKGEQWWLTDLEDAMNTRKNLDFYGEDPWTVSVIAITRENGDRVSMNSILDGLRLEATQRTRKETDRIASILRLNGYNNNKRDKYGNRIWTLEEKYHTSGRCGASRDNSETRSETGFQQLNNLVPQDEKYHTSGRCGNRCGNTETRSETGFQELNNQLPHLNDKSIGIQYTSLKNVMEETNVSEPTHQNNKEVMEETKNEKMYQVHTFLSTTSGNGGKNTSSPFLEPVFGVPHVSGNPSGYGNKRAKSPIKIEWKDEFKSFKSTKFLLDGNMQQGRLDVQNQEIIYAVPSKNKTTSIWYRISVEQVEFIN
ncbi:MAG: hypothetical protein B7C55_08155 [Actinomycetales bacterium mxb001]|nr:MAG: hypothetical protein B7C55_08155 [Actinomycetales bacterium mxb001]